MVPVQKAIRSYKDTLDLGTRSGSQKSFNEMIGTRGAANKSSLNSDSKDTFEKILKRMVKSGHGRAG